MRKDKSWLGSSATRRTPQPRARSLSSAAAQKIAKISERIHADNPFEDAARGRDIAPPDYPPPGDRKRLLEASSEQRKMYPITTGLIDYFPDACALVAEVSFLGNQKHNPGEPLHWARGKSMDHADCIARHLAERGGFDGKLRHTACLAWRAMALLQEEAEREFGLGTPRGATDLPSR